MSRIVSQDGRLNVPAESLVLLCMLVRSGIVALRTGDPATNATNIAYLVVAKLVEYKNEGIGVVINVLPTGIELARRIADGAGLEDL